MSKTRALLISSLVGLCAGIPSAMAANGVANVDSLRQSLNLNQYSSSPSTLAGLKIAILDNGFSGYLPGHGQLPDSTQLVEGPQNALSPSPHGLGMAEIVWAMTGKHPEGPRFYLINTNGYTNFKAAVDFVVHEHVDVVLYSQVWAFGSNFDGTGFINETVNRATRAGIVWINAAGNFGKMVYEGGINRQRDPSGSRLLRFGNQDFLKFNNQVDENEVTLTLSWSDFHGTETFNTAKDLDVLVYDSHDHLVGSSELVQRGEAPPTSGDSKLSSHARESLILKGLDRGTYRIRVRRQSENFLDSDRFRVLLQNDKFGSVDFPDHTAGNEIFAPADNPNVITVGEGFEISSNGPTADGRTKPDLVIPEAIVSFSNGTTVRGSSSAAALFTGVYALMKSSRADLSYSQLMTYVRGLQLQAGSQDGLTPALLTGVPPIPTLISDLVPEAGRLMIHPNGHFVVLSPVDPITLPQFQAGHATRQHPDDALAIQPYALQWIAVPKALGPSIASPWVEFRNLVASPGEWVSPSPALLSAQPR